MKIGELNLGQTFHAAEIEWTVLRHYKGITGTPIVTYVVSKDIVERRPFDTQSGNNLGESTLLAYLNGEFLKRLEALFGAGVIAEQSIDLTSEDGLKDNGSIKTKVGLLDLGEYRQYRDMLPALGDHKWWWLATPYSSKQTGYASDVCCVYARGTIGYSAADDTDGGVRPAFWVVSSTQVPEKKMEEDKHIEAFERALLDMTAQFSLSDDQFIHRFMSPEEQAYKVLGIKYGDNIEEVYNRFREKWGDLE